MHVFKNSQVIHDAVSDVEVSWMIMIIGTYTWARELVQASRQESCLTYYLHCTRHLGQR